MFYVGLFLIIQSVVFLLANAIHDEEGGLATWIIRIVFGALLTFGVYLMR